MMSLKTGDLLLFSASTWYSRIIEFFTASPISHVAIVYKKENKLYALESSLEPKNGVQLVLLDDLLEEYSNKSEHIYVMHLEIDRSAGFLEKLDHVVEKVLGVPYDVDPLDWLAAYLDVPAVGPKKSAFFCSALAAYIYVQLSVVQKCDWTLIRPVDFQALPTSSEEAAAQHQPRLQMKNGVHFSTMTEIFSA